MRDEPIADPAVENLGPAMLALRARQRRFVVGWIGSRGKNGARVARAAGYEEDRAKVTACELVRNPRVLAALKEEADRRLDEIAVLAILKLEDLIDSEDEKIAQKAVDSVLDRTGRGRTSTQNIHVEHTDARSTAQLLEEMRRLAAPARLLPVIEGEVVS